MAIIKQNMTRPVGRRDLTQQAWVAQTLHISKKGVSSELAFDLAPRKYLEPLEYPA